MTTASLIELNQLMFKFTCRFHLGYKIFYFLYYYFILYYYFNSIRRILWFINIFVLQFSWILSKIQFWVYTNLSTLHSLIDKKCCHILIDIHISMTVISTKKKNGVQTGRYFITFTICLFGNIQMKNSVTRFSIHFLVLVFLWEQTFLFKNVYSLTFLYKYYYK